MNNFYRFLKCAALLVLMMACMMPAMAQQHPFTLTEVNGTQHYYLIQSADRTTFYALPQSGDEDSKVSTTSIPNANMRWYFMDAGSDSDHQYYYIVNSTGRCLYRKNDNINGIRIKKTYAEVSALNPQDATQLAELNTYQFYLEQTGSDYYIHPKGSDLYVNKKGGNVPYGGDYYFKTSDAYDAPSKWRFVAIGGVTWLQPFTVSTDNVKHYYKFQNVTSTSFYLSNSGEWATVSNTDSEENIWYFLEAGADANYSNCHYYFIVNAVTNQYLYYTEGTENDVAKVLDYNSEEGDNYRFLIVDAAYKVNNNYTTGYTIVPKLRQAYFSGKDSFAPMAMSNDSHLLLKNDRNTNNYDSHWKIVETEYVGVTVKAPTITNNYDGTISLSTTTQGATIYYTTDETEPTSQSNVYTVPFNIASTTVIKAIAYLNSDYSSVSTYNVPKYTTPTISYNNSTSEVTIICTGATGIYYTSDGSTPTTSSAPYSAPFTVSSGVTIKAIATHPGYLNSDVATRYIQDNDYSQNYLTFNVLTAGEIPWVSIGSGMAKEIFYRINGGSSWTSITAGSNTISVVAGDVVEFKGSNSSYAQDKSNYSGFDGGTATYDISGNIMSLIYGDNFVGKTTMSGSYNFCSIFKLSKAVSAENLILPATTLTNYCYRAMFSYCTSLETAPELPATTLAQGCYWYMFERCAISTAPDLDATELVAECYGHMFENCSNLNYIKCLATSKSASKCLEGWVTNVASTGTFVKKANATWTTGVNAAPSGWLVIDEGTPDIPTISCDGREIELTCGTEGADIYYQLDHSGSYTKYTSAIEMTGDTFIECYSEKDGKTSSTTSQTCVFDSRTIYEYSNQSLDTWTYGGNTITTPYSINAIDGHSSSYAKGTFNFETEVNLRGQQPTYLWFQHADQSASIYVDNELVEKHWGGYNAFFVDISGFVHKGTNKIKVALKNNEGNNLAPAAGDFNFNATLGKVKLFTSPYMPSMNYGYDGFHITSTVSSTSATINVKTTIPAGATVVCTIIGDNCNYSDTQTSDGTEMTFTKTITSPHLWNGTIDPYLYNVKLEIYHDNELYHKYERPYGLRFFEYVINDTEKYGTAGNPYTGFLLNGQPYLLRGVCVHDDLEGKANALNDADYTQEFDIITDLGCNFLRLAHYPHPKEVYDKCDQLGIIVQTEAPWVNSSKSDMPDSYWTHLEGQCADMVNQHYNHPCIMFWGVGNEINTSVSSGDEGKNFVKGKIESYRSIIQTLMPDALVGYTVSHGTQNGLGAFNNPTVDWIGQNIYVGWYIDQTTNNPTSRLNTSINNATSRNTPCAYSEYGCGGTQTCHSDEFMSTTTTGNNPRHDIEYQMWLHEGHIAAIKDKPELIFTSQWQLFDIAVSNRQEGYKVCLDGGETVFEDNELKRLNNKGLVERDHKTKKDTYYLYKAWWNTTDLFVHICGKNYLKTEDRVIKCYTNDGSTLTLYVNGASVETVTVTDNIATFAAIDFSDGDVITVSGATTNDTFTIHNYGENVFVTKGDWNTDSNWSGNTVPAEGSDVMIAAKATIPANYVANVDEINVIPGATLTIADGGQLICNNNPVVTVQKDILHWTIEENNPDNWYFIASPVNESDFTPSKVDNMLSNYYDLYRLDPATTTWENYKLHNDPSNGTFLTIDNGKGYLYANSNDVTISFTGAIKPHTTTSQAHEMNIAPGYNLIGNPYTFETFIDKPYYSLNEDGGRNIVLPSEIKNEPIKPCTGVIVDGGENGVTVGFYKESQNLQAVNNGNIQMTLTQTVATRGNNNVETLDKAIVSFNEGSELSKFYFGTQDANIYIPKDNKEYAIVSAEASGEIPVCFKARENGEYTLSFSSTLTSNLSTLTYLHLIDNITGADIDLLNTPSYTFSALNDDYASRFRLVFSTNLNENDNENFAFFSNGNLIVTGDGLLQVFDVLGKNLLTQEITTANCQLSTANLKPGLYVLRLVNGDNVKTQKIVIK